MSDIETFEPEQEKLHAFDAALKELPDKLKIPDLAAFVYGLTVAYSFSPEEVEGMIEILRENARCRAEKPQVMQ